MFTVKDVTLLTRAELAACRPQDMAQLAADDQGHALRERKDRIRSPMLIAYGFSAHYVGPLWDDEELAELSIDPEWKAIFKSLTDGKDEFEMVDGNPVRRETTQTMQSNF